MLICFIKTFTILGLISLEIIIQNEKEMINIIISVVDNVNFIVIGNINNKICKEYDI